MKRLEALSERLRIMHEVVRIEQADGLGGEEDASICHSGLALISTKHALKPTDDALKPSGGPEESNR